VFPTSVIEFIFIMFF